MPAWNSGPRIPPAAEARIVTISDRWVAEVEGKLSGMIERCEHRHTTWKQASRCVATLVARWEARGWVVE